MLIVWVSMSVRFFFILLVHTVKFMCIWLLEVTCSRVHNFVTVNGRTVQLSTVINHNDLICHRVHRHEPPVTSLPIQLIHEDSRVVVVNKPSSIPVSEWLSEWAGEWVSEWVGRWVNEWVSDVSYCWYYLRILNLVYLAMTGVIHIKPCKHAISYNSVLQDTIITVYNHQIKCV